MQEIITPPGTTPQRDDRDNRRDDNVTIQEETTPQRPSTPERDVMHPSEGQETPKRKSPGFTRFAKLRAATGRRFPQPVLPPTIPENIVREPSLQIPNLTSAILEPVPMDTSATNIR